MTVMNAYKGYVFGSVKGLTADQMEMLISSFDPPHDGEKGVLGGRGRVARLALPGVGRLVVKSYYRGGLIRYVNQRTHLRIKSFRSVSEFDLLARLKSLDVSVPEPVAWVVCGRFFYQAWLVTKLLPETATLADVADADKDRAARLMASVRLQVERLIEYKVFHVDFHPGNVLVDSDDRVFIIDFDRAKTEDRRDASRLRLQYERRWRRAVIKHNLPECLVPLFGNRD